jgi:hypothetical protein
LHDTLTHIREIITIKMRNIIQQAQYYSHMNKLSLINIAIIIIIHGTIIIHRQVVS